MTPRDHATDGPGVLVVVASRTDADVLSPLGRGRHTGRPHTALIATGPDPMQVDLALDELGSPAERILLLDVPASAGPALQLAVLLPRLDDLLADARPRGVVVRGGTTTALAAAQCAVWRGVPVVHVPVADAVGIVAANQAAVVELVAWQGSPSGGVPHPAELALHVHRSLAPADGHLVAVGPGPSTARHGLSA